MVLLGWIQINSLPEIFYSLRSLIKFGCLTGFLEELLLHLGNQARSLRVLKKVITVHTSEWQTHHQSATFLEASGFEHVQGSGKEICKYLSSFSHKENGINVKKLLDFLYLNLCMVS